MSCMIICLPWGHGVQVLFSDSVIHDHGLLLIDESFDTLHDLHASNLGMSSENIAVVWHDHDMTCSVNESFASMLTCGLCITLKQVTPSLNFRGAWTWTEPSDCLATTNAMPPGRKPTALSQRSPLLSPWDGSMTYQWHDVCMQVVGRHVKPYKPYASSKGWSTFQSDVAKKSHAWKIWIVDSALKHAWQWDAYHVTWPCSGIPTIQGVWNNNFHAGFHFMCTFHHQIMLQHMENKPELPQDAIWFWVAAGELLAQIPISQGFGQILCERVSGAVGYTHRAIMRTYDIVISIYIIL